MTLPTTAPSLPVARAAASPTPAALGPDPRIAVVIVTRDRCSSLLRTLDELQALPEAPRVVVVDNGSSDDTIAAVRQAHPHVEVIALPENLGSTARTAGVERVDAPYVAFSDDDSWWAPGALARAADLLDANPKLALVAARVLLGDDGRLEPACEEMAASPLPREPWLPGPALLGFIACGAVVRRTAYLEAGGFHPHFGIGGEEELLAMDLAAAGWQLAYVEDVVAHHHPSPVRNREARRRIVTRNALWCAWLRRPAGSMLRRSAALMRPAVTDPWARRGVAEALRGLPWVLRERQRLPGRVEVAVRQLEGAPSPFGQPDYPVWQGTREDMANLPALAVEGHAFAAGRGAQPDTAHLAPRPGNEIRVSIVIPTYRRDESLAHVLERLAVQEYPPEQYEIVAVDDGHSESVPRLVEDFARQHPRISSIRALPGEGRGPAAARNIGWRAARGTVIAFIDDDAYPADGRWLAEGVAPFHDESVVGVSGAVTVPADEPPTDFQRNVKGLESGVFITCNAFYRRSALEQVGGFDEAFRAPYREDSDLQFRVEATGGKMLRNPRAHVIHPAPRGRFAISLRLQRYSQYNALIAKKHPARFRQELERRPPWPYYGIIGSGAAALLALATGRRRGALAGGLLWAALEGRFFQRRARGVTHTPRHLADLALTSVLIPPLSIYWRLRGAVRYRVPFL